MFYFDSLVRILGLASSTMKGGYYASTSYKVTMKTNEFQLQFSSSCTKHLLIDTDINLIYCINSIY